MIPSHYMCPNGWHKEYNGYIMAGHHTQVGSSMYYCIDESLEQIRGTGDDNGGYYLYIVHASGSLISTSDNYALTCVVCTK